MRPPLFLVAIALTASALTSSGCSLREGNTWNENQEPAVGSAANGSTATAATVAPDQATKIILFAPLALGPLETIHPDAKTMWASDLALRVSVLGGRGLDGRWNQVIPASDAHEWGRQRVAGTRGVHLVVLTEVVELGTKTVNHAGYVTAMVEMRAVAADGNVLFRKRGYGEEPDIRSPKLLGPANDPRSKAAWGACSAAVGALLKFLETQSDDPKQVEAGLISVAVRSDPTGAEIIVDDIYRGTTPMELKLPSRVVVMRIEKAGYLPWQRSVQPSADMKVEPALVRVDSQK